MPKVKRQIEEVIHTADGEHIERTIFEWVEPSDDECDTDDTEYSDSDTDESEEEDYELDDHDLGIEVEEVEVNLENQSK